MDDYSGYSVGLLINGASETISPSLFSFVIADSVYSSFPTMRLSVDDGSGLLLELGSFTQGIPLNVKLGVARFNDPLDVNFISSRRDVTRHTGANGLNGALDIRAIHESFLANRDAPNVALKGMTASDAIRKLFPGESRMNVDGSKGNIEAYAFDDPYAVARDVILPQASDGSGRPFMLWRDLSGALNFMSAASLEARAPAASLRMGAPGDDDSFDTLLSFLPFNEGLDMALRSFAVDGRSLGADLSVARSAGTVADGARDLVPVLSKSAICGARNFSRRFNPDVDYDSIDGALKADAMRAGYFVDKALCSMPLHAGVVAGSVARIEVSMDGGDGERELSQTFSGNWLVEQSHHIWDGAARRATTELVLCRSSMKPHADSIIVNGAFGS